MLARAESDRDFANRESASHKGAMASRYDTFKEEAQAMAAAQEIRIAELRTALDSLRGMLDDPGTKLEQPASRVRLGSIVTIRDTDDHVAYYFIASAGGGETVEVDQRRIVVITPRAPLGAHLVSKEVGDQVEVSIGGRRREFEVVSIE